VLRMTGIRWAAGMATFLFFLTLGIAAAQQPTQPKQDIPDAPSASRPPQPFPSTPPVEPQGQPPSEAPAPEQPPSGNQMPPSSTKPAPAPAEDNPNPPPHPLEVKTVPEGSVPPDAGSPQDELYKLSVNVNEVIVPVRVTDDSGRLVNGLLPKDFSVYEDGNKRVLNFFTSDPLAISAAVIFDLGMPDVNVQKVNQTFGALGERSASSMK
jgi:hypothetical protein